MIKARDPVTKPVTVTPVVTLPSKRERAAERQRRSRAKRKAKVDIWADFHETVSADG